MKKYREPKRPNLAVIDEAIHLVQSGQDVYSCCALENAETSVAGRPANNEWGIYVKQYKQFNTRPDGSLPEWWNRYSSGPVPRLKALAEFRQACIDAALPQRNKGG